MKKLLIIALLSTFGMLDAKQVQNTKVCQSYIEEAKAFKKTMGEDKASKDTFKFYLGKVRIHCGNIVSKSKFEKKSFTELMMKSEIADKEACKSSIAMASEYSKNDTQSELIVAAHKENIADKCGSLMAAHVSSFCLHDEAQ